MARIGTSVDKARLTAGTQDLVSTAMGGVVPKAALVGITLGDGSGGIKSQQRASVGFTDGARQVFLSFRSEDGAATTDTGKRFANNAVGQIITNVPGVAIEVKFTAWIPGGMRINVTSTNGGAYAIACVFFGGDGLEARAGTTNLGNVTTPITHPLPGSATFTPSFIIGIYSDVDVASNFTDESIVSIGIASNESSIIQRCHSVLDRNGLADSQRSRGNISETYWLQAVDTASNSFKHKISLSAFGAGSFDTTATVGTGNNDCVYLAVGLTDGTRHVLETLSHPTTAPATVTQETAGFAPQLGLFFGGNWNADSIDKDPPDQNNNQTTTTHFAAWDRLKAWCGSTYHDFNANRPGGVPPTVASSLASPVSLALMNASGVIQTEGIHSFTGKGFRVDYTNNNFAQRFGYILLVEAQPPGGTLTGIQNRRRRWNGGIR